MQTNKILAMLLILAFAASMAIVIPPNTSGQEAPTMKTYAIMDAVPNPVGVGEQTLLRFGVIEATGDASYGWEDITVTITDPDGQNETKGPYTTDSTGATADVYTPTKVGTYKITCNFPEQENPVGFFNSESGAFIPAGTVMKASTKTITLVVEETSLPGYPDQPLPTEYWSRPVDAQLRSWFTISGNWLSRPENAIALYNDDAPETAHVLWAKDLTYGGLTGGLFGDVPAAHESGDAYEGKFSSSVIMNGILYYNRMPQPISGNPYPQQGIYAVDLHTGKEQWFRNETYLGFGQTFYFNSFNTDGVFNYLWDTKTATIADNPLTPDVDESNTIWKAYDPYTAEWLYTITNVPSGTQVYGPSGEILIFVGNYTGHWMAMWNSTACGQQNSGTWAEGSIGSWGRNVHGNVFNGSDPRCYSWNVTLPTSLTVSQSFFANILKVYPDRVVSMVFNQTQVRVWGMSTEAGSRGNILFDSTWSAPSEWLEGSNTLNYVGATDDWEGGVIALWNKELTTHYAFSTETGKFLWNTEPEHWLDAYGWGNAEHTWYFAYDHLYSVGVGGIVYAYNLGTGKTDWNYNMTDPYNEPVTGQNWWGWIAVIADGKVYVGTLEHSAENPIPRGGPFICLNASNGAELWRVNGMFRQTRWGGNAIMGDSIIATMDTYDQRVYAVGKGPTQTSITASPAVAPMNTGVMIQGYVTDISPGAKDDVLATRFPNGVPAVSDDSQSDWMLYVYKQFARPMNTTGVEVSLSVLDANGNYRNIGTTTADANGFYSFQWMPDIEGKYTVFASFTGSKAYFASNAQAAFGVNPSPTTPAPTAAPGTSIADTYLIPGVIAIIVAIVIVGAVLLIALRKRP